MTCIKVTTFICSDNLVSFSILASMIVQLPVLMKVFCRHSLSYISIPWDYMYLLLQETSSCQDRVEPRPEKARFSVPCRSFRKKLHFTIESLTLFFLLSKHNIHNGKQATNLSPCEEGD